MILQNKLNITNQVELAKAEERLSKQRAKQLSAQQWMPQSK